METKTQIIRKSLEELGIYSPALDLQIEALVSAWQTLELARKEASTLDKVTVTEDSRYGKKTNPHPVFRVMREAEASITKQLKVLGLTTGDIFEGAMPTEETDLTADIMNRLNK